MPATTRLIVLVSLLAASILGQVVVRQANNLDIRGLSYLTPSVAFVLTADGKLWRSGDEGETWEDQSTKMVNSTTNRPTTYFQTADPDSVLFLSNTGIGWRTTDVGATYEVVQNIPKFNSIQFHPQKREWALGLRKTSNFNELHLTQDFGSTWRIIETYVSSFSWGDAGGMNAPLDRVYATVAAQKTGSQFSQSEFDLYYSDDFFGNSTKLFAAGYSFRYSSPFFFAYVENMTTSTVDLHVATDALVWWKKAQFPFKSPLRPGKFDILDTSTGAVWLTVDPPGNNNAEYTNLYQSDARGYQYVLTLSNLRHQSGVHDIDDVSGIEGIYIANVVTNPDADPNFYEIKTVITFDNGGGVSTWRKLIPPTKDSNGNDIICQGDCSLHLHGTSDYFVGNFGPFYSTDNAIGLIMATGNIGPYLSERDVNTYFSRDAGLTWNEVRKGPSIYEFGDHGSIIVLADTSAPTTDFMYSLDEGLTWVTQSFSNTAIDVENIIIEPSNVGKKFLLYGIRNGKRLLFSLDFTPLQEGDCTDADYEEWQPWDGDQGARECLLGVNTVYLRRKRDARCFNGADKDRIKSSTPCTCTEDDWQCDFGFERNVQGGPCLPESDIQTTVPPDNCQGTYPVTNGYRKVPGDGCTGGVDHGPTQFKCPTSSSGHSIGGWIALIIIVILFAGAIAVIAIMRNERLRAKFSWLKLPESWSLSKLVGYAPLHQRPQSFADEEFGLGYEDNDDEHREFSDHDITSATSELSVFTDNAPKPTSTLPAEQVPTLQPPPTSEFNPRGATTTTTSTQDDDENTSNNNNTTLL